MGPRTGVAVFIAEATGLSELLQDIPLKKDQKTLVEVGNSKLYFCKSNVDSSIPWPMKIWLKRKYVFFPLKMTSRRDGGSPEFPAYLIS